MDDITELADLGNYYTGVVTYYKDKNGKQQKIGKGDMIKPKWLAHLYDHVHSTKKVVDRKKARLEKTIDLIFFYKGKCKIICIFNVDFWNCCHSDVFKMA